MPLTKEERIFFVTTNMDKKSFKTYTEDSYVSHCIYWHQNPAVVATKQHLEALWGSQAEVWSFGPHKNVCNVAQRAVRFVSKFL